MRITRSLLPQQEVKLPLPLFGGIFWVILHDFIRQNYKKNSQTLPFFLNLFNCSIFSLNCHIVYFKMYFQYFSFLQKYPNNVLKMIPFCNFWNRRFVEIIVSNLYNMVYKNIPSKLCTFFISKCIFSYVLI